MKPCNFPERKRQRRLGALERLMNSTPDAKEIEVLRARTAGGEQFGVRTKKYGPRAEGRRSSDLR